MFETINPHKTPGWFDTRRKLETCESSVKYLRLEPEVIYESSDVTLSKKERSILEIRNTLIKKIKDVEDNFEDLRYRQITLFNFKEVLESIKKDFMGDPPLFDLILCLFYATKNSYSENLTREQIKTLETAIYRIDKGLNESDVDTIVKELISVGFTPLPRFNGLAEIYERQGEI